MTSGDVEYYRLRAKTEGESASRAKHPKAAACHKEMAKRYGQLAEAKGTKD